MFVNQSSCSYYHLFWQQSKNYMVKENSLVFKLQTRQLSKNFRKLVHQYASIKGRVLKSIFLMCIFIVCRKKLSRGCFVELYIPSLFIFIFSHLFCYQISVPFFRRTIFSIGYYWISE